MKICFVVPKVYGMFNSEKCNYAGGTERQIYYLSTELAKNKEFSVICSVADFGQDYIEMIDSVTLWKSFSFSESKIKAFFSLMSNLKKINADVYIFQATHINTSIVILLLKLILRKKIIYMVASDSEVIVEKLKKLYGYFGLLLYKASIKKTNKVTVQTLFQKEQLEKTFNIDKSVIIRNIIPKEYISNNTKDKNTILWVGRCSKIKNPEIFIDLAEKNSEREFVMIAPPATNEMDFWQIIKNRTDSIKNLQFIDYVQPDKIVEYYQKAMIYVMTSEYEGFSNTMMEAMAAGCAIMSYKVNPDSIIDKYQIGSFANGNLDTFTSMFKNIIATKDACSRYGENAQKFLSLFHLAESVVPEFEKVVWYCLK